MTALFDQGRLGGGIARAAALGLLALAATLSQSREARAQWTTSGTNTTTTNNVGVGTTTPTYPITVLKDQTGATTVAAFNRTDGANAQASMGVSRTLDWSDKYLSFGVMAPSFGVPGLNDIGLLHSKGVPLKFGSESAHDLLFFTNGFNNTRMTITGGGLVGIGTATPSRALSIEGPAAPAVGINLGGVERGTFGAVSAIGHWFSGTLVNDTALRSQASDLWIGTYSAAKPIRFVTNDRQRLVIDGAGNVGVGTSSPGHLLHVHNSQNTEVIGMVENTNAGATAAASIEAKTNDGYAYLKMGSAAYGSWAAVGTTGTGSFYYDVFNGAGDHVWRTTASASERMRITNAGNVGIGTTAPASKLHVVGDITVTGNINAKYQDVAEWVPTKQQLAAATVVVLDTAELNHVRASAKSYDTGVAGVISAQPGISLGEKGEGKVLVATTGRVKVKVDASRGAIRVGDLLVTSDVAGVAMRSQPLELGGVPIHRPGTLIGKALEPLATGTGEILVLLSLQ